MNETAKKGKHKFTSENNPARDWNHPRRCQAKLKRGACHKWALKGFAYCKFHGGAALKAHREGLTVTAPRSKDMARLRFYSKRLGPRLQEFIEQCIDAPESDQLQLLEELALMRSLASEAVTMYSRCLELPESNPKRNDMILAAGAAMQAALEEVRVMADTAAKINATSKDKFSVHALHDVRSQLVRIVHHTFGHDEAALIQFTEMVERQLRLPQAGVEGTLITPDADVMQMDELVPIGPEPTTFDNEGNEQ